MHVAIVEDDPLIARAVTRAVRERGHECTWVPDGAQATRDRTFASADLVVLDLMLPQGGGLELLQAARAAGVRTPVIVLTALGTLPERLAGFAAGADDYVVKPFALDELLARIEALRRRVADKPSAEVAAGPLRLHVGRKQVTINDRTLDLTPTEASVLELLLRHAGQVVTRSMLCEHVWGFDWDGPTNVIEVHINRLRGKIDRGRERSLITTIRGRGYALAAD
jgi:two-component system OmpR family response regulator/two-component system copper resistance phosphate regulon response regulator CusR